MNKIATKIARRYARRCWWADFDDLYQEASVAVLRARGTWDPAVGVPFGAYAWRAAALHLRAYLWRQSAPVHETDHRLHTLRGAHRASLEASSPMESIITMVDVPSIVEEKRWREAVAEQLDHLFTRFDVLDATVARRVLLNEESANRVAADLALPVQHVYRVARQARVTISQNALMYELWSKR